MISFACTMAVPLVAQTKQPAVSPAALAKLAEPWPDAEAMHERRVEAERRPLFASNDAFSFTLAADFKQVNKDRSVEGKRDHKAVLTVAGEDGKTHTLNVTLRTRGHFRLRATSCSFVPLRVQFVPEETRGTIFEGQKAIKLVTHCQNDKEYEQYVMREYLVYKVMNTLTPRSFRARLTKTSYVQAAPGSEAKPLITRLGMFIEDDDDVARRMEGRSVELPRAFFKDLDQEMLAFTMVFNYMIGNTDFSIYALHNVRLVRTPSNVTYTVPYDFDLSGLVNTPYAIPERTLGIRTVRDRLYRGPCLTQDQVTQVLGLFRTHKAEILALYESLPDLDKSYRSEAKDYLEQFFRTIEREGDVRRTFVEGQCSKKPSM